MRRLSEAEKADIWDAIERGEAMRAIGRRLGRSSSSIGTYLVAWEGRRPRPRGRSTLRLSLAEREEISRGIAAGRSLRGIARQLGRAPSTISREIAANGGCHSYRALLADPAARRPAHRPKAANLPRSRRLRRARYAPLAEQWAPPPDTSRVACEVP